MADEDHVDDTTMNIQLQGFLDEWHFRVLHSGLATTWDRNECATAALELFELCGLSFSDAEKKDLVSKDEADMVAGVVAKMSADVRRTWDHMALQLQLVMSAASRVRCTLDEGSPEDLARMMEEGDAGVNQQILKQTILQAAKEVAENREIHDTWESNMKNRLSRMMRGQQEFESARQELDDISAKLASFGVDQNEKSKKFLTTMAGNNEKVVCMTAFQAWRQWHVKWMQEKDIHEKFQAEIENSRTKLIQYKQARVANIRQVMMRSSADAATLLVKECFKMLAKNVQDTKDEAALQADVKAATERMAKMKASQKDNARKSMMRFCSGNERIVKEETFQEWAASIAQLKQEREFEKAVKEQELKLQQFMKTKSDQAKGVLQRMTGGTDTGIMFTALKAWVEDWQTEKKSREMEELMKANADKFKSLNSRMKDNATGKAVRSIDLENENLLMQIVMNWHLEMKVQRVVAHYSGQLDNKKHQLEAVQTMFQSFASQLEKGIESTPRKGKSGKSSDGKPPQPA